MTSNLDNTQNIDEQNVDTQNIDAQNMQQAKENDACDEKSLDETSLLKAKIEEKDQAYKELFDKFQRTLADFDNFRKRTTLEKSSMFDSGFMTCIEKMLPIFDNFERAISSTPESEKETPIFKGLSMIYSQMEEAFLAMGVTEIEGVSSSFDPNIHNAVLHIEDDQFEQNTVIEVLQKGYKFKDKVLRPSMVKVAN